MSNIKKIFCVLLAVLVCVLLPACSGGKNYDKTNASVPDVTLKNGEPVSSGSSDGENAIKDGNISSELSKKAPQFVLSTLSSEYAAGETVTVSVWLKNAPLTASFDFYIITDGAEYVEYAAKKVGDLTIMADGAEGTFRMMGIVATTVDIDGEKLAEVTFKIPDDAVSGDKITLNGVVELFSKGTDESGDEIEGIADKLTPPTLTLKVK